MGTHHNSILDPPPSAFLNEIQDHLAEVLRSVPFRTSRQCQDLFRYVVEHSLKGAEDSLRERVIGIQVFGRAPDYDTAEDPVVRLRAADVRKRLAQYYQAAESAVCPWKIEIPTGSYRAQFHRIEGASTHVSPVEEPSRQTEPPPLVAGPVLVSAKIPPRNRGALWVVSLLGACLVAVLAGLIVTRTINRPKSAFDLFWEPVLASSRPILVCTGSNGVYILSLEARARYRKSHPLSQDATPNLEALVPKQDLQQFKSEDFVPIRDIYLTVGDAAATAEVSSLFTARHRPFDLRFGSDLSFGDLREGSAVLIGAFNNSWTLSMTDNLRFVFAAGDSAKMHVQDRLDPSRSWWPKFSGDRFSEDYAIVSRILDSKTGAVLVTIAGLDQTGTRAAGDFVTDPQMIANLAKQAPKDWNRKNMQVVLHTKVANEIPGPPTVVAVHYW